MAVPDHEDPAQHEDPGRRAGPGRGIDYERLYAFRFRNVARDSRQAVWDEIAAVIYAWMGRPQRVLDPAAGYGEFIDAVPAAERWIIDIVDHPRPELDTHVNVLVGDARTIELPAGQFDGVFVSNLLEHFATQEEIGGFLRRLHDAMVPGGRIAVLGPNFRYCTREYFDCADHTLALTHRSVEEHCFAAGFVIQRVIPRFLPYSFTGRLPSHRFLVHMYLRCPPAWRVLGKQFLVLAEKPTVS